MITTGCWLHRVRTIAEGHRNVRMKVSHFSLLCSSRENVERLSRQPALEGFSCGPTTEVYWESGMRNCRPRPPLALLPAVDQEQPLVTCSFAVG